MKKITILLVFLISSVGLAQQKPATKKNEPNSETRQKQEQAEEEIRKSRAEKKAKLEAARKNAKEQVNRDTINMNTKKP